MKKMTSGELRSMWLNFFKSKGHAVIPSASVIPENDPTVLFTTAGMHPLVPYLLGSKHPAGTRLTDVQKCIRTGDIDEVGDASHLTFFEMLGNWSLGDYFKKEMIAWSWEFLTSPEYLGLDKDKLAFTVFEGEGDLAGIHGGEGGLLRQPHGDDAHQPVTSSRVQRVRPSMASPAGWRRTLPATWYGVPQITIWSQPFTRSKSFSGAAKA